MKDRLLEIKTQLQILKPAAEVYESIVDPSGMSNYFISGSSGRMETGATVYWKFPEFDFEFPVRVSKTEPVRYISFNWESEGVETLVEINLEARSENVTIVTITEKGRKNDEAGIKWLQGNTAGWANFLACLKAWLEYGINLRKGAFDFMAENK